MTDIEVVESDELSKPYDKRYVVIEKSTGKLLDDANGYGYKSRQNAYRGYGHKSATPAVKKRRVEVKRAVREWVKSNPEVVEDLGMEAFYASKDGDVFGVEQASAYLSRSGIELPFTVAELLKNW